MIKSKLCQFVRYGGLNLKSQKGYTNNNPTYHSPPTKRGIYAMPLIAQDLFLIGSIAELQKDNFPKTEREYKTHDWEYRRRLRKTFYKDFGFIWHHLKDYCDENVIIAKHGYWIKTDILSWIKAFKKADRKCKAETIEFYKAKCLNEIPKKSMGMYSKDFCEVFFDEKV